MLRSIDMAGDELKSKKSILSENGFEVIAGIEGMEEQDGFADIFADHLAKTDIDVEVTLK